MKKITHIAVRHILFLILISVSIIACNKKSDTPAPITETGMLMFHIHTDVDTNEVDNYGTVYTTSAGRKISVNKAQLYISNIQLIKLDGSTYNVPDVIVYKIQETEVYTIGQVPIGNYKSVSFQVGLSPTTNAIATGTGVDTVLNHSTMWLGSTSQPDGYVFVNFQGSIDTTTNPIGSVNTLQPFKYLIATNANYKKVTMPDQNYTVVSGQTQFIHMIINYNKLFTGIQLNNSSNLMVTSASDNASSLGMKIGNNIPSMFKYEY
jgi:hypothetical protein